MKRNRGTSTGCWVLEGVMWMEDMEWSTIDWLWDAIECWGKAVEVMLGGITFVGRNDADWNQVGSVFRLGQLGWLWMDLNGKIDSTNFNDMMCRF